MCEALYAQSRYLHLNAISHNHQAQISLIYYEENNRITLPYFHLVFNINAKFVRLQST